MNKALLTGGPVRPLRVLLVAPSLDAIGGQSIQADLIFRRLRDEPSLQVSFQPINPRPPSLLRAVHRVKYARTLSTFPLYCAQLFSAVRQSDVVQVFSASYFSFLLASTPAIYLARYLRKPIILNYHSGEAEDHLERSSFALHALRLADRIVVPSDYLVRVFARFGLSARPVFNAVDLGAFKLRARPKPRPKFLVNRSFEAHYNVAGVLRAFALIQQRYPDALLTVAGDGPQRTDLQRLVNSLSLRNIRFTGRVPPDQMPAVYDEHDVWLNASEVDNMPLSILEAYACGLAVISTSAGGIPTIVRDRYSGLLSAPGDVSSMAKNAISVIEHPQCHAKLIKNGHAECEKYTWEAIRPKWIELLAELAPEGTMLRASGVWSARTN